MAKRKSSRQRSSGDTPKRRGMSGQNAAGEQPEEPPSGLTEPTPEQAATGHAPTDQAAARPAGPTPQVEVPSASAPLPRKPAGPALPESDPMKRPFTPEIMDKTAIAIPLLN